MKFWSAATLACGTVLASAIVCMGAATPPPTGMTTDQWFAKFQTAWDATNTYTATLTAREVQNGKTQDRVYTLKFQKPTSVRLDITGGDGKGSAAVWQGGDTVRGHKGGFLAMFKLNLNIHDRQATSLRGTTIVQSYFGSQLDHMKSLKWKSTDVAIDGDNATFTGVPEDPSQDDGIIKEVMTLGANGLPLELIQYDAPDSLAKDVKYSDVKVNVDLPASTWQL
jgi:outer membrane lipoprotein-sorting protein